MFSFTPQGLLYSTSDCLKAPVDFVRLWQHEATRVYGDKLVEDKDIEMFNKTIHDFSKKYFEVSRDVLLVIQHSCNNASFWGH